MLHEQEPAPTWVLLYVAFLTVISLNTAVLGYAAPQMLFVDVPIDFDNAAPITAFYATRNLSVLVLCVFALLSRSTGLLFSAVLVRFVIESIDLGFTLHHGIVDVSPALLIPAWLVFFTLPQLACLWALREGAAGRGWTFSFAEEVQIEASRDAIWSTLCKHEDMPNWVTLGLKRVRLIADGDAAAGTVGSIREILFVGWPAVTERFMSMDVGNRYSYKVIGGMPHLRDHLGTVEIDDAAGGHTVRWAITFVFHPLHPLSWLAPVFVAGFRHVVATGLGELKRSIEAQP